jgi:hypothetical protein
METPDLFVQGILIYAYLLVFTVGNLVIMLTAPVCLIIKVFLTYRRHLSKLC